MKQVYVKNGDAIEYFIANLPDEKGALAKVSLKGEMEGSGTKKEITTKEANSEVSGFNFYGAGSDSEETFLIDSEIKEISENSFGKCKDIKTVYFAEKNGEDSSPNSNIKGINLNEVGNFTIGKEAFSGCANLETIILPKIKGLLAIEENAFSGCFSLRTVVAVCNKKAKFRKIKNPFADCPSDLVFVCTEGSDIDWFARENGYRSVHVQ